VAAESSPGPSWGREPAVNSGHERYSADNHNRRSTAISALMGRRSVYGQCSQGSANLGAGVARLLADTGLDVREVTCALTVRERRRLRCPGKSEPTDALAIARITAREHDLPPARQAGLAEDLKVLSDYRDELLGWRTSEANRLHADLAIVCPGYAQVCRRLTAERSGSPRKPARKSRGGRPPTCSRSDSAAPASRTASW
jgi:hypothetical protein